MQWETPWFVEIDMNAEIGAYQPDPGDGAAPDPDRSAPASAIPELETGWVECARARRA